MRRDHFREWLTLGNALALAGVFLYAYHALSDGSLGSVDDSMLTSLKAMRGRRLDMFFLELTALGSVTVLTLLASAAVLLLLLDGRVRAALQLLLAAGATSALTQAVKALAERPRPPLADRLDVVTGFSFPSGHASSGAAIYLTLALLLFPKLARVPARAVFLALVVSLVALLSFSRAYLAVHYPSDALAGLCLGSGIALLSHLTLNPRSAWHLRGRLKTGSTEPV